MAKRESTFKNMLVVLSVVTLLSAGSLGSVYNLTKDAIEAAKLKAQNDAIGQVLPPFEEIRETVKVNPDNGPEEIELFPAYSQGNLVGVAVKSYTKNGFSGHIGIMVGLDLKGNITGYQVLEHKETPGLGSKMDVWFNNAERPGQNIIGRNPSTSNFEVSKDGGEIDAITASTITSRAFLEAVVRAHAGAAGKFPFDNPASLQNN
jgi:Na+-translocating ferredoxin:NAD+ oxidoreductase subunit G